MKIPNAVSATEAASLLGVSRCRVHQLIKAKLLPAIKWGDYWMIERKAIDQRKAHMARTERETVVITEDEPEAG